MSLKSIFVYLILFSCLLLPSRSKAQLNCDTLILTNGDAILINANHLKFKKYLKYEPCDSEHKEGKISIPQKEVKRIGINHFFLSVKRKTFREYNTRVYFMDDSKITGGLVGVNDSSIVIKHKRMLLYKYDVKDLKELEVQKNNPFAGALIGGAIGLTLGVAIGRLSSGDANSLERLNNQAVGGLLGFVVGGVTGAAIGDVKFKIQIDGDQDKYEEGLEQIKFVY